MQNWYCLVNFPDRTQSIHLIPGPAPVPDVDKGETVIRIVGKPGTWYVRDITVRVRSQDYAAEIWVEPRDGA